jgi:hypothetical protein
VIIHQAHGFVLKQELLSQKTSLLLTLSLKTIEPIRL